MSDKYIKLHDVDGNTIGMVDREWAEKNLAPQHMSFSVRGTSEGLYRRDDKKFGVIEGGRQHGRK